MFHVVELLCAPRVPHVAVLALISIGFAGCSADMSTRLSQDSFSNPFASQPGATASVPTAVERRELSQYGRPQTQTPQYQSSALPPPTVLAPPILSEHPSSGVSGGGRGFSSHALPWPGRSLKQPIVRCRSHGSLQLIVARGAIP